MNSTATSLDFEAAERDGLRVAKYFLTAAREYLPDLIGGYRAKAKMVVAPIQRLLDGQAQICWFTLFALDATATLPGWTDLPGSKWLVTDAEQERLPRVKGFWRGLLEECAEDLQVKGLRQDVSGPEIMFILAQLLLLDVDLNQRPAIIASDLNLLPPFAVLLHGRGLLDSGNASRGSRALGHRLEDDYRSHIGFTQMVQRGRPPGRSVELKDVIRAKRELETEYRERYEGGDAATARVTIEDVASHLALSTDTVKRIVRDGPSRFRDL